jgi:hypothetical protein
MAKLSRFAKFALLAVVAAHFAACSSDDKRSLVVLDLQLAPDVAVPPSIHLVASQGTSDVRTTDVPWTKPSSRTLQTGFFIPSGITGPVTIAARITNSNGDVIAEGKHADAIGLKVGGTVGPYTLVIEATAVNPPGLDGGTDAGTGDASVPGSDVRELGDGNDRNDVGDGRLPDLGPDNAPDAVPPTDGKDSVSGPEAADTVDLPANGADAPTDVGVLTEVGHTPAWEPAQNVENDLLNPSYNPAIVVDPISEHVYVAWSEAVAIKVKRWNRVSGAWEKTVVLESRGDPNGPAIGADAKGNVLIIWGQNTGTATIDGVWTARTTDGTTWSPATRITPDRAFDVRLAVGRNGMAHAVYNKQTSNGWPLFTASYDGTGWTENPTTLDANETSGSSEANLVVSGAGDGLLIFSKGWGVAGSALTGSTFTTPTMLDPNYQDLSAYEHAIAINRKGEGIALWTEATGSNTAMLGRTYNPSSGWSNVLPPLVTASTVAAPAVALDEQGNATVLWQQSLAGGALNVVSMHGSPTGSWTDPVPLETDNGAGSLNLVTEYAYPSVAIDGSGDVLAVWRKKPSASDAATYGAYGSRFAGGSWLTQTKLGLKTGFDIFGLGVSVADSGFGAAAFRYWSDTKSDPDASNVFVAFFR